jgi:hypothetical protein
MGPFKLNNCPEVFVPPGKSPVVVFRQHTHGFDGGSKPIPLAPSHDPDLVDD